MTDGRPKRQMLLTEELVRLCHRDVADPGPNADRYDYFSARDYADALEGLLAGRPEGPFWVFVYGSLIWKPEFPAVENRRATAKGWHRAFSLEVDRYRGTPAQPGYMICLDKGGSCDGLAIRLHEEGLREQLGMLLFREVGSHEALEAVRWIDLDCDDGPLRALTFYAAPERLETYREGRSLHHIAYALARSCGEWGSGAAYLRNTVVHLQDLGIEDPGLWILQELVAREIQELYCGRGSCHRGETGAG
jgi:cation transport protein ChaC